MSTNTETKLDSRQLKAWEMLSDDNCDIRRVNANAYIVRSQSNKTRYYGVQRRSEEEGWTCECPDYANRQIHCKHILAVKLFTAKQ